MTKGFYLAFTYTIVDYGVHIHQFWTPYFLAIKDINKPLVHAQFHTDWFVGVIQNQYPIAVYGVIG